VHDDALQGHGYKPLGRSYPETSVGWYRRIFEIPKEDLGRRTTIEFDGAFRDTLVGVRALNFDVNKGFFLNGKPVKIKGTCNHQDHAGVGAALPDRLQSYRIGVLKEMGSNSVRTSHNMPTPELVEACDRMGMMMLCETRRMSSNPEGMAQFEGMIKRYRNSPSIIMWSMGNGVSLVRQEGGTRSPFRVPARRSRLADLLSFGWITKRFGYRGAFTTTKRLARIQSRCTILLLSTGAPS